MIRSLFLLVLLTQLVGCASKVIVLRDSSPARGSLALALKQGGRPDAPIVFETHTAVQSATMALPDLRKVAGRPIVAVTGYEGWFWFATDVARDSETGAMRTLIAGYAARKGSAAVMKWSVW